MVISILDYSTGETTIIQDVCEDIQGEDLEKYIEGEGFKISEISYMASDKLTLTIR